MRKLAVISFFLLGFLYANAQAPNYLFEKIDTISLKKHLQYLAGDACEGRGTGQPGYEKAVAYVVEKITKLGVEPLSITQFDGSTTNGYQQKVPLEELNIRNISLKMGPLNGKFKSDFVVLTKQDETNITDDSVVFLGFGLKNSKLNDLLALNLTNQVVVMYAGTPKQWSSKFSQKVKNRFSDDDWDFRNRLAYIWANNPKAVYIVASNEMNLNQMSRSFRTNEMKLMQIGLEINTQPKIPTIVLSEEFADKWFAQIGLEPEKMLKPLAKKYRSVVQKVYGKHVLNFDQEIKKFTADNVLAYLPGKDTSAELIVLSAHLDHLGKNEKGVIYYGADDDGTGSVGLLSLLEAFAPLYQNPNTQPKRGVLFLWVTAEEKGLLGSRFYTRQPVLPLAKTIANLNIDMIGRVDDNYKNNPNYIYVIGSDKLSTDLHQINEMANNQSANLMLDYRYNSESDPNRYYYRSDHYNFVVNGIPAIFYFSGVHPDYHQATDTEDKILYGRLKNVLHLVLATAHELVSRPNRIIIDKQD